MKLIEKEIDQMREDAKKLFNQTKVDNTGILSPIYYKESMMCKALFPLADKYNSTIKTLHKLLPDNLSGNHLPEKLDIDLERSISGSYVEFAEVINSLRSITNGCDEIEQVVRTLNEVSESPIANPSRSKVEPEDVTIFIGHGHNPQWRDLKDHLSEKHGYRVITYETGVRAGLTVTEVLDQMRVEGSFACLVLTGEDIHSDGTQHARENVIHELGFFQDKFGRRKTIILLEDGVKLPSNLSGTEYIKFSKNNIKETYGEVLAVLRREFGKKAA